MKRKILSLLMIITMMISFVQLPIQAALVSGVTEKAKINLVALQEDATTAGVIGKYGFKVVEPAALKLNGAKEGDIFYIGVQVDDLMNIAEPAAGYGVLNLSLAFTYDSTYVEVLEDYTEMFGEGVTGWATYMDVVMSQSYNVTSTKLGYYFYHMDADKNTYDISTSAVDTTKKEVFLNISWGNTEVEPTYVFPDEDIIAIIPMQFTQDAPTTETKLFSFSTDNEKYCLDFGVKAAAYQLPNGSTPDSEPSKTDTTDILHVVEYSMNGVNFFPKSYSVDFYASKTAIGSETAKVSWTSIPENSTPASAGYTTLPTKTELGLADSEFITGFLYDDGSSGAAFTTSTALTSSVLGSETTLNVYPVTETGYSVKFYETKDNTATPLYTRYSPVTTPAALGTNMPADPTDPTGSKVFAGWYTLDDTTQLKDDTKITDDMEVYAKWTDKIPVTFYPNQEGPGYGTETIVHVTPGNAMQDETPALTAPDFVWEDADKNTLYSFNGWNTESNGSGDSYTSDDIEAFTYKSSYADGETAPPQTFYAMWDASGDGDDTNDVTVKFDGNTTDTVDINPESVTVNNGAVLYKKDVDMEPERDGYNFLGWSESPVVGATVIDFEGGDSYTVTAPESGNEVTLYAHWKYTADPDTAITVNFYHDENGDGINDTDESLGSIVVKPGEKLTAAQLPGTGALTIPGGFTLHDTDKWITAEGEVFAADTPIDDTNFSALSGGGTTLTVKTNLMPNITVTYDVNGGDDTVADKTGKYNDPYAHPASPTKSNYAFAGWYTAATDGTKISDSDAGSTGSTKTYQDIWEAVKAANGTYDTGKVTLYAQWTKKITITFRENYTSTPGSGDPLGVSHPVQITPDVAFDGTIPPVSRNNYTLKEWNTEPNGSGTSYNATTLADVNGDIPAFSTDTTLYAIWEANTDDEIDNVTVTFKPGQGLEDETITVNKNDFIFRKDVMYDPVVTGYKFLGWYPSEAVDATRVDALSVDGNTDGYQVTENTTLYGHWEYTGTDAITVNFVQKDGTPAGSITVAPNTVLDKTQLPTATDPETGYTFDGWYSAGGTKLVVTDTDNGVTGNPINATTFRGSNDIVDGTLTLTATYTAEFLVVADPDSINSYTYIGDEIKPKFDVYYITDSDAKNDPTKQTPYLKDVTIDDETFGNNFDVTIYSYTPLKADSTVDSSMIKSAGDYVLDVQVKPNSALAKSAKVTKTDASFRVGAKLLDFTVDPATQQYKVNNDDRANGIAVTLTTALPGEDYGKDEKTVAYSVKYYTWKDSVLAPISAGLDTLDPAKYIARIETYNNYEVNSVTKTSDSTVELMEWSKTDYPAGTSGKGDNLLFQILAIDPSIDTLKMESVVLGDATAGTSDVKTEITTLYKDAYTTTTTFNPGGVKPTANETSTYPTYYIRVTDVEADELVLTLTLTNKDTTYVYYSDSTTPVNTLGAQTVTIEVDLSDIDVDPEAVTITTKTSDGSAEIVYTFYVQQLIAPKITLKPGNSPYGMIMSETGWDDTKKGLAKTEYDKGNKFVEGYKPAKGDLNMVYTTLAWTDDIEAASGPTDSETNMDRNDNALFLYQGDAFVDPGFTVVNSLGVVDTEAKPTISVEMDYMGASHGVAYIKDSAITKLTFSNAAGAENDLSTIGSKYIRPGRYKLKYSYTDTTSGSTTTEERYVVMLWTRGDANLSTVANPTDSSYITQVIKEVVTPLDGVTGITRGIYYYRVLDVNMSAVVNPTDSSYATQMVKGAQSDARMYPAISE